MSTAIDTDVLVAGGGPCGLMLANELGRRGNRCLVVDATALPFSFINVVGTRVLFSGHGP
jgi:2-polyprenyl-6-methoxyphenol hydroxylase-like FAD-dependent oxidoreductase